MNILEPLLMSLKQYGFVIINESHREIIDILRSSGLIHLLNIHKLNRYIVLEINFDGCEKECHINCKDDNEVSYSCYGDCLDKCVRDKVNAITKVASKNI